MPKISVIMPNHNNSAFLQNSIDSVFNQTLRDIEFLVVDDCSDDGSDELLAYYKKKDKRFNYFVMERRLGAAACRNFGNNKAKSDIIMVMDSGDVSHEERAKATFDFFKKNKDIDIYSSACVEINAMDEQLMTHEPRPFSDDEKPSLFHPTVSYRKIVPQTIKYREGNLATDQYEVFFFEAFKKGFTFGFNHDFWVKKLRQKQNPEMFEKRMIQRVKNYKEFGIEIPKGMEKYANL